MIDHYPKRHNFRRSVKLAKGTRSLLRGRGPDRATVETRGEMLRRVLPNLMGMKRILVLNDEGHHCYRERVNKEDEGKLASPGSNESATTARRTFTAGRWISSATTTRTATDFPARARC